MVSLSLKYTTDIFSSHRSHSNAKVLNCHSSSLPQWFETVIHLSQTLQAIQGKDLDEHFNHHQYVLRRYKRKRDSLSSIFCFFFSVPSVRIIRATG